MTFTDYSRGDRDVLSGLLPQRHDLVCRTTGRQELGHGVHGGGGMGEELFVRGAEVV